MSINDIPMTPSLKGTPAAVKIASRPKPPRRLEISVDDTTTWP